MAVPAGLAGDVGSRFQRRVREIEDELSRFFLDSVNKFPVPAQNFVTSRLFELTAFCGDLRVEAATERDAAVALRGQLVKTRKEKATLQASGVGAGRGVAPAGLVCSSGVDVGCTHGPGIPGIPPAPGPLVGSGSGAVAQIRGSSVGSREPRPHVGITNTWRSLHLRRKRRRHVTYCGYSRQTSTRHRRASPTSSYDKPGTVRPSFPTKMTLYRTSFRRTRLRALPSQFAFPTSATRISGSRESTQMSTRTGFFIILKERNAGLEIDEEWCKVRVPFRKRSGNNAFIGEVDPDSLKAFMSRTRPSLGWTMLQVFEDLHVPTCMFCATYGRGRTSCPQKTKESRATCMKCGGNHQAVVSMVRTGGGAVCCSECRRAGRPAVGHPVGFPGCPLLMERVARLRARTNYSPHK
ncbi:hypothetical protein HPB51_026611 [Rhipicephalus microplus]|uniref:Uncharacterized protein n=1 Tax=Rhipicephalus microplus TaxID=6941 RepID=A0A9J6D275_RHIMP|nr:hypothetical protein HPB51_026611 [Rhipicephalus microplus]